MSSEDRVLSDTVWTPERGIANPEVRGISWENFLLSDDKYLGKWRTDSGVRITPETALQSTVVLASCRILAETISGLPIRVYEKRDDGSEEPVKGIPLYKILSFAPNEWQTKPEFFEQVMMNLTLWGNSYTRIRSGKYGSVSALDNLHPSRMDVERLENGRLRYSYTDPETGRLERYTQDQIMHVRWTPEQDGIKGMVPVEIAREAIGLARACEQHAARFWANSARPGVVLTTEGTLTAEAAERLRDNWERLHKGSERAYRTAVLTGGMKVTELGFTNESSQFNATRAAQTEEIARIYRLPLHLIQGASGGDLEVQGQEFVTYTLMPWITRIESAISRSLIVDDDTFVARFDVRGLLRANSMQRASYYSTMMNLGVMTINECRRLEGMKDLGPDGDHHFVPMNTQTLEDATKPKPEAPPDGPPPPAAGGPPSMSEVKTGKAPIASPKGEASKPKMEDAIEESSADWEDAVEDRAFCPNGEGNGIDNSCSSSGGAASPTSETPASLKVDARPEDIASRLGSVDMDDALRAAGGARSDTKVFVRSDHETNGVHIECTRDVAGVKDGLFSVTVVRNDGTEQDPEVVVDHKVIEVTPAIQSDPQKRQAAAREFMRTMTDSVTSATKSGVAKVVLNAAGHSSKGSSQTFRGYTIWPRMGFDAPIPYHLRSELPPTLASSRTLLDLHKTPEGTRWWRDNGVSVDVQLDLTKLDSPQMQVFNRFVNHFKRDRRDIEMFEGEDWLSTADQKKINEIWGTIWAEGILDGYKEADQDFSKIEKRAFCATGVGNGVDNSCGGGQSVAANDDRLKERVPFVPSLGTSNRDHATPPTDEEFTKALIGSNKSKGTKIGEAKNIDPGTPVALRIDIPAFNWSRDNLGKSIYAVTIHENKGGKSFGAPIAYEPIARLSGPVTFASKESEAIKVATGESSKFPLATVKGSFDKSREVPADIDSWTPVGYDPKKAAYFYDKRTGREVEGGTDAVSVGNTVFVRMPQYGDRHVQHQYRHLADSWGLESRALSPANQELYKAQEEIVAENGKWPQSEAHYMEKNPFASRGMKCGNCLYFEAGQCEVVAGSVSPEGICKLWIIPEEKLSNPEQRAFCPTGEGGGINNSCGDDGQAGGGSSPSGGKSGSGCPSPCHEPDVTGDKNEDGVTDAARVGVPAMDVPPPPVLGRVPNLGEHERKVEEAFISHFESDPDKVASQFRELVVKQGDPPTFGTDDAKCLTDAWSDPDPDKRAQNRATLNVALHQCANAIAKRAFVQHLDTLKEGDEIMVTVGGCGAGKGFALKSVPQALELKKSAKVIWDSAGDQNATENPWIQKEAESRGLKVTYVYVHADPRTQWADPERGVVKRASDPKDGRMVDAKVFADSYAIGAKNHDAFHKANKDNPSARFVFLDNTGKPKLVDGVPKEALSHDSEKLAEFAEKTVEESSAPPRVKAGGLVGRKIWPKKKAKNG
jgi:HK97 family phage portal protein